MSKNLDLKSGDTFYLRRTPSIKYVLQKLPDFDLWILVSESWPDWAGPSHWCVPATTPLGAFGNCEDKFIKL